MNNAPRKATLLLLAIALFLIPADARPVINSVQYYPDMVELYPVTGNVTFLANVTDDITPLHRVLVKSTRDDGYNESHLMQEIAQNIFRYEYMPNTSGIYDFIIWANNTIGWTENSSPQTFYVFQSSTMKKEEVQIIVEIKAGCCGMISFFYVPDIVIQNQTVVFLLFFSNCGNTELSKYHLLEVKNASNRVIWSEGGLGIPAGTLSTNEDSFFYAFWSTTGIPVGNYTARANVTYTSYLGSRGNATFNFTQLNSTAACTTPDANNYTRCVLVNLTTCDNETQENPLTILTTQTTNVTVPNMAGSTSGYEGSVSLDGLTYHAYTFQHESCSQYCYACLSQDTVLQNETECNFEGSLIPDPLYAVSSVEASGASFIINKVEPVCHYSVYEYNCTVIANGSAVCSVSEYCLGYAIKEKNFQIVTSFGESPQNITQNQTIYVPQLEPWVGPNFLLFREMPHIIGQNDQCSKADPWGSCTRSRVKLIIYNQGIKNASYVTTQDNAVNNYCSAGGNCYFETYKCVPSDEYYCMECKLPISITSINGSWTGVGLLFSLNAKASPRDKISAMKFQAYKNSTGWVEFYPDSTIPAGSTNEYSYLYSASDMTTETYFRVKITDIMGFSTYSAMYPLINRSSATNANAPNITAINLYYNKFRQRIYFRVNVSDPVDDLTSLTLEYFPTNANRSTTYSMYEVATPLSLFQAIIRIFAPGDPRTYEQVVNTTLGGMQYYRIIATDAQGYTVYSDMMSFNDSCVLAGRNVSAVRFIMNRSIVPQGYALLQYEAVPTVTRSSYTAGVVPSNYTFQSYITFYPDIAILQAPNSTYSTIFVDVLPNETGFIMNENTSFNHNSLKSRTLILRNVSTFDYFIDSNPSTEKVERHFNQNTNTTFKLTVLPLSTPPSETTSLPWEAKVRIPDPWDVESCIQLSGPACTCTVNNTDHWVMCQSTSTPALFDNITLALTATAFTKDIFLLDINRSIDRWFLATAQEQSGFILNNYLATADITFPASSAYNGSIRVHNMSGGEIASYVWNATYTGQYYNTAKVTFLLNLSPFETRRYTIYYGKHSIPGGIYNFTPNTNQGQLALSLTAPTSEHSLSGIEYDEFFPGLWLTSKEVNPLNITFNITQNITQNITVNVTIERPLPQPYPIPIPQPQPQEKEIEKEKQVPQEIPKEVEKNVTINITVPKEGSGKERGLTQIAITLEPYERNIAGEQGVFIPLVFKVTNIGNVPVDNISILSVIPTGWEAKDSFIDFLDINESVNRTLFVKPPFTAKGVYVIPAKAVREGDLLDMDYVMLTVLEASDRTRIRLEEVPRKVIITQGTTLNVPVLIKNVGRTSLHDVIMRLENHEQCLSSFTYDKVYLIGVNESKSVMLHLAAKDSPGKCDSILIVGTKEDAYAFSDMQIVVAPPSALIPLIKRPIWILTLIVVILIALIIGRNVRRRVERIRKLVK